MQPTRPDASDDDMEHLPTPWLRTDAAGLILATNRALRQLIGREEADLFGSRFDSLLSRHSRIENQSHLQPLLKLHGHVEEFSLSVERATGGPIDVLAYAHSRDGGTDVVLAPLRQRHRIEDELRRVKRAADHAPGMIFQLVRTAEGRWSFPYVSEVIRKLCKVTPQAARESADAVFSRIDPQDMVKLAEGMKAAADAGKDWRGVYRFRLPDGRLRWHEAHATPRQLDSGMTLWHGHAADVTERRSMEQAVADKEASERLHRSRSEFLSRISHELRTPMNGILGFAQVLASDVSEPLTERQHDRVEVIRSSATHLLRLINEVLEVTRIESGQLSLTLQALPVRPQLESALRIVESLARDHGVQLDPIDCARSLGVMAHEQRLHQVLVNLLSNAVKYNRPGGRVSLAAAAVGDRVTIAVIDTGQGLSAAQQSDLFQAFNRLGAEKTGTDGTGLGLVITRQLVNLMGGELSVTSQPGLGSRFSICLAAAPGVDGSTLPAAANFLTELPPSGLPQTHGRVLFVEDNPVNVMLMQAIVAMRPGIELSVAGDGAEALRQALGTPPELLLLDMHLPDTTGLQLLTALRAHPALRKVPAVVVSADARSEDIERARLAGFDAYWTKPLDVNRTLAELDGWLGPGQARRPTDPIDR